MNIMKLFTKQRKAKELKYYTHIDHLPIANFKECEKGNLQYLYMCDFFSVPDKFPEHFTEVYNELFYQFPNPDMQLHDLRYKIALNYNKAITEDARAYISKAQSLQIEFDRILNARKNQSKGSSFNKTLEALEQWRKMDINIYKMSTARFYTLLDMYQNHVAKINVKNGRK